MKVHLFVRCIFILFYYQFAVIGCILKLSNYSLEGRGMEQNKNITLNSRYQIPQIGYGVYMIWDYNDCKDAVLEALSCGYRHIDTAQIYKNERAVGAAIRESGIDRSEIFVTTKIWVSNYGKGKTTKAVTKSLERLNVEYIDLVLLHQPGDDYLTAWAELEHAVSNKQIRSIGISNFKPEQIDQLIDFGTIVPAVNQIECHPYLQQTEIKQYLASKQIAVEAWYPLGHGDKKLLNEQLFVNLAKKYQKSPAQIILRWHLEQGHIVFPKSLNPIHIADNIAIYDFALTASELDKISLLDKQKSYMKYPKWVEKAIFKLADKNPLGDRD